MVGKSKIATIAEAMIVGSIAVAGFATSNPIASAALLGIGLNLASNLFQKGFTNLKEDWFLGTNGILNHDIQFAFARAFREAVSSLEAEYFESTGNELSEENRESAKYLFDELKLQAGMIFVESEENPLTEEELQIVLYEDETKSKEVFLEKIESQLQGYDQSLKDFFRENLLDKVLFFFGEELKKDDKNNNKAWRAFQRLLLEGIKKDVSEIKGNVILIQEVLTTLEIASELSQMHDILQRDILESFSSDLKSIKKELRGIRAVVEKPRYLEEEKVRQRVSEIRQNLFMARSHQNLARLLNDVNYLLDQHPNFPDTLNLKDEIELAMSPREVCYAPTMQGQVHAPQVPPGQNQAKSKRTFLFIGLIIPLVVLLFVVGLNFNLLVAVGVFVLIIGLALVIIPIIDFFKNK